MVTSWRCNSEEIANIWHDGPVLHHRISRPCSAVKQDHFIKNASNWLQKHFMIKYVAVAHTMRLSLRSSYTQNGLNYDQWQFTYNFPTIPFFICYDLDDTGEGPRYYEIPSRDRHVAFYLADALWRKIFRSHIYMISIWLKEYLPDVFYSPLHKARDIIGAVMNEPHYRNWWSKQKSLRKLEEIGHQS